VSSLLGWRVEEIPRPFVALVYPRSSMCVPGDAEDDTRSRAGGAGPKDARDAAGAAPDDSQARVLGAWRAFLRGMASDADAALSAGLLYGDLSPEERAAWLAALREDVLALDVPRIAVYAPLLAIEDDPGRRAAIEAAISEDVTPLAPLDGPFALAATEPDGFVVAVVASPLYLAFVELLVCRFHPDRGVATASHEPLFDRAALSAADGGFACEGALLHPAPLDDVVEGLAHAILADRRRGEPAPAALRRFSHLFTATPRGAPHERPTPPPESDPEPDRAG